MLQATSISQVRQQVSEWRQQGQYLAFVPTMGNLHQGHLSLVELARRHAERVCVSIFVNPLQFGAGEDFASYPRTLSEDSARLQAMGVDLLFVPTEQELYPEGREQAAIVQVPELNNILCGEFRPGHFDGVATVVAKLFNIVHADIAVFGKKDYQQWLLIRRLVELLNFPLQIIAGETAREADGLAMSSRNRYLSSAERGTAAMLHRVLTQTAKNIAAGQRAYAELQEQAMRQLSDAGFKPEYVQVRRQSDLLAPEPADRKLVVLAAARLGQTRLIDNVEIGE